MHIQITWIRYNWYGGGGDFQCLNFRLFGLKQYCCMSSTGLKYSALVVGYSYEQVNRQAEHCTRVMSFKLFLKFYNWRFTAFFCTCKKCAYNSLPITVKRSHTSLKIITLLGKWMVCTQITVPIQTKCHTLKYAHHHLHPAITYCTNRSIETMPVINKTLKCKETYTFFKQDQSCGRVKSAHKNLCSVTISSTTCRNP